MAYYDEDGGCEYRVVETTPGRVIMGQILPHHHNIKFDVVNKVMTLSDISNLIDDVCFHCGPKATAIFADHLMAIGFKYMSIAGISYGKDDLVIPPEKEMLVKETEKIVCEFEQQYLDGFITHGEKYNKVVDAWDKCGDQVAEALMKAVAHTEKGKQPNSVYMMVHSKARGSMAQLKQSAGMRGLMAKPTGEIIETPIVSNFKEGLSVLEYFTSTHGSRKGLIDTALKTANSGYLTRRLVDVANDCIVSEEDCGTSAGIWMRPVYDGASVVIALKERILGRFTASDIVNPNSGTLIVPKGGFIDEAKVEDIVEAGIDEVYVRSTITCESKRGVCAKCYGRDLARGTIVSVHEAIGVVAAQSIGEPGTQLTLRTFHIGGAAQKSAEQSSVESSMDAKIAFKNMTFAVNSSGNTVVVSRKAEITLVDDNGRGRMSYKIPYGARLRVVAGESVKAGQPLAEWDPYTTPVVCETTGFARFVDLVDGQSLREVMDETTGISSKVVIDWKQSATTTNFRPMIVIVGEDGNPLILANKAEAKYFLSIDSVINIENGGAVKAGDIIAKIPKDVVKTRDITGGLPRISELFEARMPKDPAVISEADGTIEFGRELQMKRRIIVVPDPSTNQSPVEYLVPKGRSIVVHDGDYVKKGDVLVDGGVMLQNVLKVLGVEEMAVYLVNEVQKVYRLQGVLINDKHIEVVVRQMLQKREIKDAGDSTYIVGDEIDKIDLSNVNSQLLSEGKRPIVATHILQGITKAALHTRSFISAASFQETTRVLTEAAICGRVDELIGLKENVIVGRLMPAGTGGLVREWKAEKNTQCNKTAVA
jgi:DNA-directed RNA polymerase subunit beta'